MGTLCQALGVRHTPPLILTSESLQSPMANICELPKCSDRKKRPVVVEMGEEVLNAEATLNMAKQCHVFTDVCQLPVLGLCELVH